MLATRFVLALPPMESWRARVKHSINVMVAHLLSTHPSLPYPHHPPTTHPSLSYPHHPPHFHTLTTHPPPTPYTLTTHPITFHTLTTHPSHIYPHHPPITSIPSPPTPIPSSPHYHTPNHHSSIYPYRESSACIRYRTESDGP